jgi:hypothetical protein
VTIRPTGETPGPEFPKQKVDRNLAIFKELLLGERRRTRP